MKTKHTPMGKYDPQRHHSPGPWKYSRMGTVGDFRIIGPEFVSGESQTIHEVGVAFNIYHEANARLIAAAPEMLGTLKEIRKTLVCGDPPSTLPSWNRQRMLWAAKIVSIIDDVIAKIDEEATQ